MKRITGCIGRIMLWFFALVGVAVSATLATMWVYRNTPLGCYVPVQDKLVPGSGPYKAAQVVLARAKEKYPDIDFSKRWANVINLEDPVYFNGEEYPYWIVSYNDPPETSILGCYKGMRPGVQGAVSKSDMILKDDVELEEH
jgi:hypothetical protein